MLKLPFQKSNSQIASFNAADVQARLQEYVHDARGAYSENTLRAISGDTRHFTEWCRTRDLSSLPAKPSTVASYVDDTANAYAPTTIRRRVSSIGHMHRAAQLEDPTVTNKVRLALRRMQRTYGKRPQQAQGISASDIAAIIATTGDTLSDKRNIALLLTARDMLSRRSELVSLNVEDILYNKDGSATVTIQRSKTDQEGQGVTLWISPRTVTALQEWMHASGIQSGALFRSLRKGGHVAGRLSDNTVSTLFKNMAERAGLNHHQISGHSARVGMAQDLSTAGAELTELMTAGRWKSPQMPARYTERTRAARGAVAKYFGHHN